MYICNYYIGENQYFSEVFADSQEEAVEKALDMFGDSLELIEEMPDRNENDINVSEVKAFWVKGHEGILKEPGTFSAERFMEVAEHLEKNAEKQLDNPEIYKLLSVLIDSTIISDRMEERFEDKNDRDIMVDCYKIGIMGNTLCLDDYNEIMEITHRKPTLLIKNFREDIKRYYKGNLKKLKHFCKREQTVALTCYGLGRASTRALIGTDHDQFIYDLKSLKAKILREKNK